MLANFVYKTKGLDKFRTAALKYAGIYKTILPTGDGQHNVGVYLENFKGKDDHVMQAPNAATIWVAVDYAKYPLNFIGAAIGHELVHLKDHMNPNVDLSRSRRQLKDSEREAYAWMISNARHFNLDPTMKSEILRLAKRYD